MKIQVGKSRLIQPLAKAKQLLYNNPSGSNITRELATQKMKISK